MKNVRIRPRKSKYSEVYQVDYHDSGGRRHRKNFKEVDEAEMFVDLIKCTSVYATLFFDLMMVLKETKNPNIVYDYEKDSITINLKGALAYIKLMKNIDVAKQYNSKLRGILSQWQKGKKKLNERG